jgi:hypothetical protein
MDAFGLIAIGESVLNIPLAVNSPHGCGFDIKTIRAGGEMLQYCVSWVYWS